MICAVEGLERRDALECVAHYKELLNRVRAAKAAAAADGDEKKEISMDSVIKRKGPLKKKPMREIKKQQEEAKAKKAAAEEARLKALREANGGRLTQEELGSSSDRPRRQSPSNLNMDILISNVQLYGRQELLSDATLKLVFGTKYGLAGRNGTGSPPCSTPSRRTIPVPPHPHHPRRAGSRASDKSAPRRCWTRTKSATTS